ncbi:MAG: sulfite exporter TauE/SafE family protein [Caulobacterales bacterium]|nr:sulfite exporter TauE/SafE family protein [Caulobacterales bacterium]
MTAAEAAFLIGSMMGAGLVAGFLAGLFGIGGGFVVVPALYAVFAIIGGDIDARTHTAVGTSLATMILTSLRSVRSHAKHGAVDFEVIKTWAPWIIVGVILGLALASQVDGRQLTLIFAVGVLIMALYLMFGKKNEAREGARLPKGALRAGLATFMGSFSSLMGIGGATYAIICLTLFGKTIHQAVATASGLGAIIALPGAIGFLLIGLNASGLPVGSIGYVNIIGLIAISAMTVLTAPAGVALAHKLDATALRRAFSVYLLFTSALLMRDGLGV